MIADLRVTSGMLVLYRDEQKREINEPFFAEHVAFFRAKPLDDRYVMEIVGVREEPSEELRRELRREAARHKVWAIYFTIRDATGAVTKEGFLV